MSTGRNAVSHHDANEQAIRGDNIASYKIVDAGLRDLRQIARIQQASFHPGLAYGLLPLVTLKLLPFVTFLVARHTGTGNALGCIIGDRYRGDVRVMNIAVDPVVRRQGIATALLGAIGSRLPEGNIVLMVEESNHAAQALYQEEGFVRTGYERSYYGAHRNGIEMTLLREPPRPTRNGKPTGGNIRVGNRQ